MEYRAAENDSELLEILKLQQDNLFDNIAPEVREREGFLKVRHNLDLLRQMQDRVPQVIAIDGNTLAGYALCMHREQYNLISTLSPLYKIAETHLPKEMDYVIMGQICVAKGYRGQGHFNRLYTKLRELCNDLPVVTEIASINSRSLKAHRNVGFETLGSHQEQDFNWHVVLWP
ncbi:MAG: hypothetical protein RLZZ241_1534 [Bacteroidota bacterium]|jgi:predicted GNAT family N-acyltransferase